MKRKQLEQIIKEVIKEYGNKPTIAPPTTKPGVTPKRRTLTPPNPNIKPKPKAEATEGEKNILSKIVQRYKSKKTNELLTLGSDEDKRRYTQSLANRKPDPANEPGYVDKLSKNQTKKLAKKKTTWAVPSAQNYNANVLKAKDKVFISKTKDKQKQLKKSFYKKIQQQKDAGQR